jgi:transcriptional regulator with XRE-family HTH domain
MLGLKVLIMVRKNLQYYRKRVKRLSLDEMAVDTGISRDTLYKLENNELDRKPMYPNLKTLIAISEYLNIDLAEFLSRDMEIDDINRRGFVDNDEVSLGTGAVAK